MNRISKLVTSQRTYIVLLCSFLIAIPLQYGYSTGILIALLLLSLFSLKYHKPEWKRAYLIPFGLYGLMILSLFWSIDLKDSIRGLERQLGLVIIPLVFIFMPTITIKTKNSILYYFSLGMSVFALFFILSASMTFFKTDDSSVFFYHALVSPLDLNAIYVSVLTSLCLLFLVFKSRKTIIVALAIGLLSLFLLLLASKTIIVVTFVCLILGLFHTFKKRTVAVSLLIFISLITILIVFSNPIKKRFNREIEASNIEEVLTFEKFNKVYDWTGTTIRLFQARIFYEMAEEDEVFLNGYGINTSQDKIVEKQKEYNLWQGYYTYNFHNQYIQAWSELGIIGFVFIVLFLVLFFKQYLVNRDVMFLSLFLIMLAVFVTESYLWRQRGLYHFLLLFCLFFKTEEKI
ncbi:MAG: hypothetical protein CMC13_01530 [Flavobacteriaceae bacterium]|nr:hypothetical protein [Flavobacteriaceae bacterium]|tara:strand:- start:4583 stop:5791 length:1209 start_codon:yes stop_codon:yes gene_type:complete